MNSLGVEHAPQAYYGPGNRGNRALNRRGFERKRHACLRNSLSRCLCAGGELAVQGLGLGSMTFRPAAQFNIADYFLDRRVEEGLGDAVAIRTDQGTLTYAEVQRLANRFGQALARKGVRREERVLIALRDTPEYAGALFGILKLGAVAVMVNPDLEPANLTALLDSSRATCAVVDGSVLDRFQAAALAAAHRSGLLEVATRPRI